MRRTWPFVAFLACLPALVAVVAVAALGRPSYAQYTPEAALEHGRALYTGTCASCHGLHGEGAGMPGLGIPRIDAAGTTWQMSDIDLTLLIRNGKGAMPGVGGTWSKEDVGTVLTFLRSLWSPEQRQAHDALQAPDDQP